ADHDDAVCARHSTEPRHARRVVLLELRQEGGGIHPTMIGITRPPGKCRAAHFELLVVLGAYQRPREKKPSSASTRITMRMIQRMPMRFDASLRGIRCRPAAIVSVEAQRKTHGGRYGGPARPPRCLRRSPGSASR